MLVKTQLFWQTGDDLSMPVIPTWWGVIWHVCQNSFKKFITSPAEARVTSLEIIMVTHSIRGVRYLCLDYPESLHLSKIYFLDISFTEFLVYIDLSLKKFFCWNRTCFFFLKFALPILTEFGIQMRHVKNFEWNYL